MESKILIIDDDPDVLHLVSLIFKKAGAHVMTATDGLDGMSKLFTFHPDLITLDVMMPGANGFDVCRRIRQVSDVPIILLTALNQEVDMLRGLEAGADDFLSKPFNPDILLARARAVLRRKSGGNDASPEEKASGFRYNDGHLDIDVERRFILMKGQRPGGLTEGGRRRAGHERRARDLGRNAVPRKAPQQRLRVARREHAFPAFQ